MNRRFRWPLFEHCGRAVFSLTTIAFSEPLDAGGMGSVYRVEQLSTGEERALKVLRPELLPDAQSRERFAREATVSSKIESDHLARVVQAGIDADTGLPWIAMELLDGQNLSELVHEQERLDAKQVRELCAQLCHALGAAHRAGIVHRDLKPDNVLVVRARTPGSPPHVRLIDFGLAAVLEEFDSVAASSGVVGSPLWMAPEQVRREPVRPATDVWALGLLAFYLLVGRPYWRAAGRGVEAVLYEKLYEPIEPASARAASFGAPGLLSPEFDLWFSRCLQRDPARRYRNATEAFVGLEEVLSARPAPQRKPRSYLPAPRLLGAGVLALATLTSGWRNNEPAPPQTRFVRRIPAPHPFLH